MSANNYILIRRQPNGFIAEERDADTGDVNCDVATSDSLEEIIRKCNQYMGEVTVEYGLEIRI